MPLPYQPENNDIPVQRNSFYEPIRLLASSHTAAIANEAEPPPGNSKVLEGNLAKA